MLTGGCYCGEIRYEARGTPFHQTACHCTVILVGLGFYKRTLD